MTLRYSTGLRNFLNESGSIKQALANSELRLYSGTQPASANAAPTGTLLAVITNGSAVRTKEVIASGSFTISGTTEGTIDSVTVNGVQLLRAAVTHTGDHAATAALVAAAINNNPKNNTFMASGNAAGVVTLRAKPGQGTTPNGWAVLATATGPTVGTFVDMANGVDALNGLRFGDSAAGVLSKDPTQTWTGVGTTSAGAGSPAGWFRFVGSVDDPDATDDAETYLRLDGSVASSGGDLNLTANAIVAGAVQTVNNFNLTMPASA